MIVAYSSDEIKMCLRSSGAAGFCCSRISLFTARTTGFGAIACTVGLCAGASSYVVISSCTITGTFGTGFGLGTFIGGRSEGICCDGCDTTGVGAGRFFVFSGAPLNQFKIPMPSLKVKNIIKFYNYWRMVTIDYASFFAIFSEEKHRIRILPHPELSFPHDFKTRRHRALLHALAFLDKKRNPALCREHEVRALEKLCRHLRARRCYHTHRLFLDLKVNIIHRVLSKINELMHQRDLRVLLRRADVRKQLVRRQHAPLKIEWLPDTVWRRTLRSEPALFKTPRREIMRKMRGLNRHHPITAQWIKQH